MRLGNAHNPVFHPMLLILVHRQLLSIDFCDNQEVAVFPRGQFPEQALVLREFFDDPQITPDVARCLPIALRIVL
jgi:hypothetical protein